MRNIQILQLVMALALVSGWGQADELGKPVPVLWKDMRLTPKTKETYDYFQAGEAPRARLLYAQRADGDRWFEVSFEDGTRCSTPVPAGSTSFLECGKKDAFYRVTQTAGKAPELYWVGSRAVGDKG